MAARTDAERAHFLAQEIINTLETLADDVEWAEAYGYSRAHDDASTEDHTDPTGDTACDEHRANAREAARNAKVALKDALKRLNLAKRALVFALPLDDGRLPEPVRTQLVTQDELATARAMQMKRKLVGAAVGEQ